MGMNGHVEKLQETNSIKLLGCLFIRKLPHSFTFFSSVQHLSRCFHNLPVSVVFVYTFLASCKQPLDDSNPKQNKSADA